MPPMKYSQPAFSPSAWKGLEKGGPVTIDVFFPDGTLIDSYWEYGPTVDDPLPHWYEFLFDGTTGAESTGNRVTLHFVDGLRGDDDLTANGQIVDVGGPVFDHANLSVTKRTQRTRCWWGTR